MAYIRLVQDHEATGLLKKMFDAALERAGRVFGIVRLMSRNPPVMRASMMLYREIMFGDSSLSRSQRERLATVTSRANDCFY